MPLDSHSYLVSQGWAGKGTGLRQGAISRPLAIPQKKTLAGLGKDRDESFPFWDHLFIAASKSIQINCPSDDEEENRTSMKNSSNNISIKCTSTGIFSNRRPIDGTPATSGTNTPENAAQFHRLGLLATAKRDAAKRGLYSKFFRGPVLGPDTIIEEEKRCAALVSHAFPANDPIPETVSVQEIIKIQKADRNVRVDLEVSKSLKKKRKSSETRAEDEDEEAKRERKRRKKERKEKKEARHAKKGHKKEKKAVNKDANPQYTLGKSSSPPISQKDQKTEDVRVTEKNMPSANAIDDHLTDRKRRKREEKRRGEKIEKAKTESLKTLETNSSAKETKSEEVGPTASEGLDEPKTRKRKKKQHADPRL